MKKLIIAIFLLPYFSYCQLSIELLFEQGTPENIPTYLMNSIGDELVKDTLIPPADGLLTFNYPLEEQAILTFEINPEYVLPIYVNKGDSIQILMNYLYPKKSVSFSGKGAEKNVILGMVKKIEKEDLNWFNKHLSLNDPSDSMALFRDYHHKMDNYRSMIQYYQQKYPEISSELSNSSMMHEMIMMGTEMAIQQRLESIRLLNGKTNPFDGLEVISNENQILKFDDLKGKPTLIHFWASWCKPCMDEFQDLNALEKKWGKKINFVHVCIETDEEKWLVISNEMKFKRSCFIPKGSDESKILAQYTPLLPRYLLLDSDLEVDNPNPGRPSTNLEEAIDKILKK